MVTLHAVFYFTLALVVNLLYDFLIGLRFTLLLKHMNEKISWIHSFYVFCISKFSSMITPFYTGSLLSKPLACRHFGNIPFKKAFFITFFEQVLDSLVLFILLPFLALSVSQSFLQASYKTALIFVIAFSIFFVIFKSDLLIELAWKLKTFVPEKLKAIGKKRGLTKESAKEYFQEIKHYLKNKSLLKSILPVIILQVLIIPLVLLFTVNIFALSISYTHAFIVYWLSAAVGKFSGLPGGFGSTDLTMGGLLILYGISTPDAAFIILFFRIISLAPALIVGGILSFYLSSNYALKLSKELKEEKSI